MAKEKETQELGGFEAISNFLLGKGPEGGLSGSSDVSSGEMPIMEPSQITGGNGDVEEIKEGEEPIPEEEDVETEEVEETEETTEESTEDEGEDLSEFESDITKYLNEEFSKKLGWDITGEDAPSTIQEFVDFMNSVVEEASKPEFANEELEKLNEFVSNGGSIKDFYSQVVDAKLDLENADLEDTFTQKQIIKENFKNLGYSEDRIDKMLKRYEESGVLEEEASDALELLKEYNKKTKEKLLERQEKVALEQKEQQQKFFNDVQESIKSIDVDLGVKLSPKERKELSDYILSADKTGMTQFQKEMLSDIKKFVSTALYTKTGGSLLKQKEKQGETNAVKNLHKKLNANKGNPGTKGGSSSSSNASDGLSILSSMLRS